jgi:hypothetical protein
MDNQTIEYYQSLYEQRINTRKLETICSRDIFKLAYHNNVIRIMLKNWESGLCTWEECLMLMIKELARVNEEYFNIILKYNPIDKLIFTKEENSNE